MLKDIGVALGSPSPNGIVAVGNTLYFTASDYVNSGLGKWDGTNFTLIRLGNSSYGSTPYDLTVMGGNLYFGANDGVGSKLFKYDGNNLSTISINNASNPSPTDLTVVGSNLYFSSSGELWKYDGSNLTEITVGPSLNPSVSNLTAVGNTVYFSAYDGNGTQLWKYDGANLSEIKVGTYTSPNPADLTAVGSNLYFRAYDGANYKLWQYDGSNLSPITVGTAASPSPQNLTAVGNTLYFGAFDGSTVQLWKYDGSTASEIPFSTNPANGPYSLTAVGSTLYFNGYDGTGSQLWKYDGSTLSEIKVGTYASPNPRGMMASGGNLYFNAYDGTGYQLWKYDGSTLSEIKVGSYASPNPYDLTAVGSLLYFSASNGSGSQLWSYDTTSGTLQQQELDTSLASSTPGGFVQMGNKVYFSASDGLAGQELWVTDGTTNGTTLVSDINPGPASSNPKYLTLVGSNLYFTASDGVGVQLWKYDGSSFTEIKVINTSSPGAANSYIDSLTAVGNVLYFRASDGTGTQLWKYDGSTLSEIIIGSPYTNPFPQGLTAVGNTLYFSALDSGGHQLWKYDGTNLTEIKVGTYASPNPSGLTAFGGNLYFNAYDGTGYQLWKYDGTNLSEIKVGTYAGASPDHLTVVGSNLYFRAYNGTTYQIWKYDGSNLSVITNLNPNELKAIGNTLYFSAWDGVGVQLWKYDGIALNEIKVGTAANPSPAYLTAAGKILYFSANDGVNNQLWEYDGSTFHEIPINLGGPSNPFNLYAAGKTLYVSANDGIHGVEPWVVITPTTPTVPTPAVPTSAVYNGQPQGATVGDVMGDSNDDLGPPTLTYYTGTYTLSTLPTSGGSSTAPTNAANYTVVASYAGSTYYTSASSLATYTISAASPAVSVIDAGGTYNGNSFPASATAVGIDGKTAVAGSFSYAYYIGSSASGTASSTAPTSAGTYTVVATFTSSDGNYANGTAQTTFVIQQAAPVVSVVDVGGTYNGNSFPAAGSAVGVDGKTAVSGSFSYAYYVGTSATGTSSTSAPTSAGTYTVVATFTSSDNNYTGGSAQTTFTIAQATPIVGVSDSGGTYNGNSFPASGTALGVDGKTAVSGSFSYAYYVGTSASGTASTTAPSNGGTYTVVASFTSSDSNYTGGSAQTTFTITPAAPFVSVSDAGGTYNGSAFPATAAAVGVDGKTSVSGSFSYAYYVGSSASGTASATSPTNAGTYTVVATFTSSDGNYTGGSAQTAYTISAASLAVSVIDAGGTYNGNSFPASGTAVGIDGKTAVSGSFSYAYYVGSSASGTSSAVAPSNAGTYTVVVTFTSSDSNYANGTAQSTFVIQPASPAVSVSDAGGTYSGNPFPASGSAIGVDGKTAVSGSFNYAYYVGTSVSGTSSTTAPISAGTYTVVATFTTSDGNYTGGSAQTTFIIAQATPSLSVVDFGGAYNGSAFTATATAVGVDGKTSVPGSFTYAYYVGTSTSGTPSSTAPSNAGTYTVVATFTSSDGNYTGNSIQTTFTIAQATTALSNLTVQQITLGTSTTTVSGKLTSNTIVPAGQSVSLTINGQTKSATVGADGSFSVSFATSSLGVGAYTISYSYAGNNNFTAGSGTGSLTVAYNNKLLFDNTKPVRGGSTLTIKLELTNASGADVSSSSIAVTATSLVDSHGNVIPIGSVSNTNLFTYNAKLGGYTFNLSTKGLASGTYTLSYKAGNDPTLHSLTFIVG